MITIFAEVNSLTASFVYARITSGRWNIEVYFNPHYKKLIKRFRNSSSHRKQSMNRARVFPSSCCFGFMIEDCTAVGMVLKPFVRAVSEHVYPVSC